MISSFNYDLRKFDADDAGVYVGEIFIEKDGESYKCEVEVKIILLGKINIFPITLLL